MIGIILSILTGVFAALFIIKKENEKLKNKQKLHDIELKDAKLEVVQEQVNQDKVKVSKKLKELEDTQAPSLNDSEIEKYWNKK
jgi:hypothetical protein